MTHDTTQSTKNAQSTKPRVVLLGLGAMGTALARTWLCAGYPVTVWNRTASRAEPLRELGADVAATAAEAVTAGRLVVTCLFDDASVEGALAGADLTGRDVSANLAMQVSGNRTLAVTAEEQGVDFRLLAPYSELLEERLAQGFAHEDGAGALELLVRRT